MQGMAFESPLPTTHAHVSEFPKEKEAKLSHCLWISDSPEVGGAGGGEVIN